MYNNYFNQQQPMGTIYNQSVPEPAFTNPLTQEEINSLRANNDTFTLKVTPEEINRSICTHRDVQTKTYTGVPVPSRPGYLKCTICGEEYNPERSMKEQEVEDAVELILNILQSTKMMYVSLPDEVAKKFFSMIPYIKKIPQMVKIATADYNRFVMTSQNNLNNVPYNDNPMYTFNNILSGSFPNQYQQPMYQQPMYQQPMYQQPMGGQPVYNQQMYQQPMGGQPQQGNPFDASANTNPGMMGMQQPPVYNQQGNTQQQQPVDNSNNNNPGSPAPAPNTVPGVATYSV